MFPKLAIISVVYQNYKVLDDFFASLKKQDNKAFQVFLTDLSQKPQEYHFPQFVNIGTSYNRGYAYGVNVGLKKAIDRGFTHFCIINNDTYFEKDLVDCLLEALEENPRSIVGGKIYYAKGYEYHKDDYKKDDLGHVIWYAGGEVDWAHAMPIHVGVDEEDHGQYDKSSRTDFITGCFMGFDKEVVDTVGFWDEDYFLYFEDADYGERAKRKGIKLIYDPSIVLWHKNAQSTKGPGSSLHRTYQEKNRVRFGLKYAPHRTKLHLVRNYFFYLLHKRWPPPERSEKEQPK